jgi:glycosyltransferase involved in cell wall biosynthesis
MHVLYLSFPGGGLETNVRVLAPALREAGHQVSILYLDAAARANGKGPKLEEFPTYYAAVGNWHYYLHRATFGLGSLPLTVRSFETERALVKAVRSIHQRHGVDLIEIPEITVPFHDLPAPFVVRLHSSAWMWRRMCREPSSWADSIEASLEGTTLRRAAAVTSPSQYVAEYIKKTCRLNGRVVEIIPYAIDTNQFKPARKDHSRRLVLFVGRVEKRKGADVLLRAVPRVLAKYPECEFLFVGQVSEELAEQVNAASVGVRFLDFKPRHELVELYQQASVVVVPSLWDNSPNVVYEAMACGTPVIATRVGGIPELVDDGVTGLLVQPRHEHELADAIIALLGDEDARERMGRCGREKAVSSWRLKKIASQTVGLYQQVTNGS